MPNLPVIPESITVHLGPADSDAENVTVPFLDYVANVASSEIYPTWPESAVRANIYAQISYALNRVYTEYYRTRGYDFDITNSTATDQSFVYGRDIFENVREIASELFNNYIRREGSVEPLFAQYCDGIEVTCGGLSQWGTVTLAEQGYTPYQILTYYYGDDIELVQNAPIENVTESAPVVPLRLGSANDDVRIAQLRLNRISSNYPAIPKILRPDGIFGTDTEEAVRKFQEIFGLTADGVIGKATWYNIQNVYIGVKRLNDLNSEGIALSEVTDQFPDVLRLGSQGGGVSNLQYFLSVLSQYYDSIPAPGAIDGDFGQSTLSSVKGAQRTFGLPDDGIVGERTWDAIYRAYIGIVSTVPQEYVEGNVVLYGGVPLQLGSQSDAVRLLQEYLNAVGATYPAIGRVDVTGYFGPRTQESVVAFQNFVGLPPTGIVAATTWNALTDLYSDLFRGGAPREGQYPGYEIGSTGGGAS
ncbi:MAG: peptidoglycan-binding protein [Clostridia bacterium]|nr:peptidoglycan-binding protein [Clostridia bacterium]